VVVEIDRWVVFNCKRCILISNIYLLFCLLNVFVYIFNFLVYIGLYKNPYITSLSHFYTIVVKKLTHLQRVTERATGLHLVYFIILSLARSQHHERFIMFVKMPHTKSYLCQNLFIN